MDVIGILQIILIDNTQILLSKLNKDQEKYARPSISGNVIVVPLLRQQVLTIGRSPKCKVQLINPTVSMEHCIIWAIQFDSDSNLITYIFDKSRNGIKHNEADMLFGLTGILENRDTIEIKTAAHITYKCLQTEVSSQTELDQLIEDWEISNKMIGCGSFGAVYVAKKPNNPKLFAVKITQNNQSGYFSNNSKPTQESYLLSKINHVSIHALMHLLYRMSNILTKKEKA